MKICKKEIKQLPVPCWVYLPLMAVLAEGGLHLATMEVFVAGRFAADRAVEDYARDIWHCTAVE